MYRWCNVTKPEFLVGVVLDDGGVVDVWWYRHENHELKKIGSNDYVLFRS
jgi:hypothetical protein